MRSLLVLVALAACNEHGQSPNRADAHTDSTVPACAGTDVLVTGEIVDVDSSSVAFIGVSGATLSLVATPTTILTSTLPDGRFETCVRAPDPLVFSYDAPGDFLDGAMVITRGARGGLHPISFRGITMARAISFYASHGLAFDASKAHVLVFMAGDRSQVTLDRPHAAAQAGDDEGHAGSVAWSPGDSGRYILFPNVDITAPSGSIVGDQGGPVNVPLAAGKLTLVAISLVFF